MVDAFSGMVVIMLGGGKIGYIMGQERRLKKMGRFKKENGKKMNLQEHDHLLYFMRKNYISSALAKKNFKMNKMTIFIEHQITNPSSAR